MYIVCVNHKDVTPILKIKKKKKFIIAQNILTCSSVN